MLDEYTKQAAEVLVAQKDQLCTAALEKHLLATHLPWVCLKRRCRVVVTPDRHETFYCDDTPLIEFTPAVAKFVDGTGSVLRIEGSYRIF